MKTAVLYARVSSKDQEREGYSIPAQVKLLREYAASNQLQLVKEFIDVETAKTAGRKNFGGMIEFLKEDANCRTVVVEKTDRLYRNFKDYLTLEDLGVEIHLPKEGQTISKDSRSQAKFMHGIHVLMARNYIDNLREEVRKGMLEKAEQGIYPSRPPFGYRNNVVEHTIEVHLEKAAVARRLFELYASGQHSLASVRDTIFQETGFKFHKSHIDKLLKNPFYYGLFNWEGKTYRGSHAPLISCEVFQRVQRVFSSHNRPKYGKHGFPFSGLLQCAYDNCLVTAEMKKGKYVYYHCTGHRGKCDLPYMREEELGNRLGQILEDIFIPDEVLKMLQRSFREDQDRSETWRKQECERLQKRLTAVRTRMDQAYSDKLDGKIPEEFWSRRTSEWQQEEQQILLALAGLEQATADRLLTASRILELANKAHSLYVRQNSAEKAKLLKMVVSNCAIDSTTLYPTYRKPFDLIFNRAKNEEWRP